MRQLPPRGKFRFEVFAPAEVLRASVVEAHSLWPSIVAFLEALVNHEQDYVIEGFHLVPQLVAGLRGTSLWKHLRVVYLVKTDFAAIAAGFGKNSRSHDWMYPSIKKNPQRITKAVKMVRAHGVFIERAAKKSRLKCISTDKHFKTAIEEAYAYLLR